MAENFVVRMPTTAYCITSDVISTNAAKNDFSCENYLHSLYQCDDSNFTHCSTQAAFITMDELNEALIVQNVSSQPDADFELVEYIRAPFRQAERLRAREIDLAKAIIGLIIEIKRLSDGQLCFPLWLLAWCVPASDAFYECVLRCLVSNSRVLLLFRS